MIHIIHVLYFYGVIEQCMNETNIFLIPKKDRPQKMAEFRPINLCNVSYKIISKILCQRLKKVIPNLISKTQSAFVVVHFITNNILIAQETFHALKQTLEQAKNVWPLKMGFSEKNGHHGLCFASNSSHTMSL